MSRRSGGASLGRGICDLTLPGLPPPGNDFIDHANAVVLSGPKCAAKKVKDKATGKTAVAVEPNAALEELVYRALYEPGFTMPVTVRPGVREDVTFITGHQWWDFEGTLEDAPPATGPVPARVMVVGQMPGADEEGYKRNFVGPSGEVLLQALSRLGVKGLRRWYVTNLIKFRPPEGYTTLRSDWLQQGLHLLHHELRIVRPEFVLCLGAEATKAVLGKAYSVKNMEGRVVDLTYDVGCDGDEVETMTAQVMAVIHPVNVARDKSLSRVLESGLARFGQLLKGRRPDAEELDVDHRVVDTLDDLEALLREIDTDPEKTDAVIACDAEWNGEHPVNTRRGKGRAYLRTFQLAWRPKHAACVKLRGPGGVPAFFDRDGADASARAVARLARWFRGKRVVGHFFNSDLEWLVAEGLDLRPQFQVPRFDAADGTPAWARTRSEGGADTGLMAHAVEETAEYGLDALVTRHLVGVPPYWVPMAEWCKAQKEEFGVLEGYGDAPDELLVPYACLHGDSLVQLADGSWEKIRKLVRRRYAGKVKAFLDGKVVDAEVTNWHRRDVRQCEWCRLRTATTPNGRWGLTGPLFTPDHKVLTRRGKVPVDGLIPGSDAILTEEREFSPEQLSVFLGSLLGDGGYARQNDARVGFGFGQRYPVAAYADWKADVFATHAPVRHDLPLTRRYQLPFSRYIAALSSRFPAHLRADHRDRKGVITDELLAHLGDLGLAVWYQDDGTLVRDKRGGGPGSSRIYAVLPEEEQTRVVAWLTTRFGEGVTYNARARFIQISRGAFDRFHAAIGPYVHPVLAYKTPYPVSQPYGAAQEGAPFYETVLEVVSWAYTGPRRGNGVRYCLTVAGAGNFLTQAGFVSNCYDADATIRLFYALDPLLDCDYEGNCCREAFWESMLAAPAVLEIHTNGISVDKSRIDELSVVFLEGRNEVEERIRAWAAWPAFNIRSPFHVREFLFGEALNGRLVKNPGDPTRLRPPGAKSLGLRPILDTSKPPRAWADLARDGKTDGRTPGTGKAVLPQLVHANPEAAEQVGWVQAYRVLDQVLKSVLRPPLSDGDGAWLRDEDSGLVFDKGMAACICDDGKVRTHIYQTKETGRWSSARPPLQNISKTRDKDYKRLLGARYKTKLRSIFRASPGHVFVEADYKGAELAATAIMADDPVMIDHAWRSNFPDEGYDEHGEKCPGGKFPHPQYHDIHSAVAVLAFNLDCPPTKHGLAAAGCSHLRTLAKRRIFGLLYGQSDESSVMTAREEGVFLSVNEAAAVTAAIFEMYPRLRPFFERCRQRASDPGWVCHAMGRFRRVPETHDRKTLGDFERQLMNFPIQGYIASVVSRAIAHLYHYRYDVGRPDLYRILMQIHDAILVEVPYEHVDFVVKKVIPYCMCDLCPLYPTDLDGVPTGRGPYYLGFDVEIGESWGVPLDAARKAELGITYGI